MAEYIKRYDAMKICQNYSTHCFSVSDAKGQDIADKIEDEIAEIPTADVVEVTKVVEMLCKIKTNIIKNVSTMIENDFSEIVKDALGERRDTYV